MKNINQLPKITKSFWDSPLPFSLVQKHYLVRDFIHSSLYGTLGYFTSHASILSPEPFNFKSYKDQDAFLSQIGKSYSEHNSQIWHTPCEIFKPWFGRIIAEYLVKNRKSDHIIIYEIGSGNGTLMVDILDTIQSRYPDLYSNVEYHAIDISPKLVNVLKEKAKIMHIGKINVWEMSIFNWNTIDDRECFFLGMEVIDNFAHDLVRYDFNTNEPLECHVAQYDDNQYSEIYAPVRDPLIQKYMEFKSRTDAISSYKSWKRKLGAFVPFAPNMTEKEFIPTKLYEFLEIIYKFFPNNSLLLSDFTKLDRCIPGVNSPVVQTMVDGVMLPCSSYLVNGPFDIFFPTDFKLLSKMIEIISGRTGTVTSYHDFLKPWNDSKKTVVRSGENPMLSFYDNYAFIEAKNK